MAKIYHRRHLELLQGHGVGDISSISETWKTKESVWMLTVTTQVSGELIAGLRLDVANHDSETPLQEALRDIPEVSKKMGLYIKNGGVAELCGLWVNKGHGKLGFPGLLTRASVALAPYIGAKYVLAFANVYSRKATESLGFVKIEDLPNTGIFYYPDERYETFIMKMNAIALHKMPHDDKIFIDELRKHYKVFNIEQVGDKLIEVLYDLGVTKLTGEKSLHSLLPHLSKLSVSPANRD